MTTKENKLLRVLTALLPWAIFLVLLLFTLKVANAQSYLGEEWDKYLQGVKGFAPTSQSGEELTINFILNGIRIVRNVVGAVALVMGVLYGIKLVLARGQEDVITKQKTNFLYALIGFGILIISENVASIFNPERATTDQPIDFGAARDQLRDIVDYVKWLLGSIIVLMMTVSSVKMVMAQGEEEEINKQKKNLTASLLGILVILLANNIVNAIYLIRSPTETTAASPDVAISEFTSVIRLILVFMGPLAIIFTIYAGYLYLTAFENDEQATKGKKMIIFGIVAIVIIYGAFALVNTLTSANLALLNPYVV